MKLRPLSYASWRWFMQRSLSRPMLEPLVTWTRPDGKTWVIWKFKEDHPNNLYMRGRICNPTMIGFSEADTSE